MAYPNDVESVVLMKEDLDGYWEGDVNKVVLYLVKHIDKW